MNDLPERLDQSIRARGLFRRGQKILVAVSGGADSMVLLRALRELSSKNKWRLTVAHLNHALRGRSSDADERLVVRTAKQLGLPAVSERADVRKFAATSRLSIEMAARKLRHDFLARTAARLKIPAVALAHHADDQVELFFLRLLRGSGSEGLAGMKWRNASPANPKIELVRPLLDLPKSALLDFARAEKISFREDASNARLDIQRNRIRRELLPLLRAKYQPAMDRIIMRLMDVAGAEAELVNQIAWRWLETEVGGRRSEVRGQKAKSRNPISDLRLPTSDFRSLPVAVQRRSLHLQLLGLGLPADYDLIERLRTRPDEPFAVMPHLTVTRDQKGRLRLRELAPAGLNQNSFELHLKKAAGEVFFNGAKIHWRIVPQKIFRIPERRMGRECFDADQVGSRVILRCWQPGDRFQPVGMASAVKLQDLFTNQKVPRAVRHRLIVATAADGGVFWVENLRISEQFKLSKTTSRRLEWRWERAESVIAG